MAAYTLRTLAGDGEGVLTSYSPLVRTLLLARGITDDADAARFLAPDWERDTHDPFLMRDMQKAVERIAEGMARGETLAIWSDYDMDGIPGAVVLWETFRALGYTHVLHHTPHRNRDGFGLNDTGLDELAERGATLIITVDCGIGDREPVAHARALGLDVIVTDHHIPGEELPPAYAILNPKQEGCTYPEQMLCGAGVAFKLATALLAHLVRLKPENLTLPSPGWERWLLDLVGMATMADLVPLTGENRAFAHFGLVVLRKSRRVGIQALLTAARTDQRFLTEDDVGFTIAPRVNAASRMGHASQAFALLAASDAGEALSLARELEAINAERKTVVATMKREIGRRLEHAGLKEVIVLGNPDWKPSLLGLVAGGLAEEYGRPVFLWGREEGVTIKGSCRSGGGVNVYNVLHAAHESFLEYGGHAYSGGFSVAYDAIHTLEASLIAAYQQVACEHTPVVREVDVLLTPDEVTWDTYRQVAQLAPFGAGNPKPLFLMREVVPRSVRSFGKGSEHLEVVLARTDGSEVRAIAFFTKADAYPALATGERSSLIVHLEASAFRGIRELRLRLVDVAG